MDKRTFIALPVLLSQSLKKQAELIKNELKGLNVKWTEFENMHLTLAFPGNTSSAQVKDIRARLADITNLYHPFSVRLKGLGAFKSIHNPQVLWTGVEAEETLELIYGSIQKMIEGMGFTVEKRSFKPHLTLGRVKSFSANHNLEEVFEKNQATVDETFQSSEIIFYESILMPPGPVYKPISIHKLTN